MGHKIRPDSFRLGHLKNWSHRWFAKKNFKDNLEEDLLIRGLIEKKIAPAGVASIELERRGNMVRITIKASRPGIIIGRGGQGIENLKKEVDAAVAKLRRKKKVTSPVTINLNVEELRRSEVSAAVVAQNIAWDLEKRLPFRRTIKRHLENMSQMRDVKGAKIRVAGRLDGSEIARSEWLASGRMPLQTLRANIDYGEATAFTTYGTVGIKVWIYKGDIFD